MKAEVIKNVIIRASLKQVGEVIEATEKDLIKFKGYIKEVKDEGHTELVDIQEGHGESQNKPSKKK